MLSDTFNIIVIGAGHSGLSISYYLKQMNADHIVLDKGDIGSSWTSQRWDSFRFNTPNKYNLLPGYENTFEDQDGFCSSADFASALASYAGDNKLPVCCHTEVLSVEKDHEGFRVRARNNGSERVFRCLSVIVASGGQNRKHVPSFSAYLPKEILQLHASEYRNASALPGGSILVVGGAQSGVQITEDLLNNGKQVFLSTSKVPRVPRRYRNKDIVDWLCLSGFFDMPFNDPALLESRFPQISGTGLRGHTVSLQSLARKGAILTGGVIDADIGRMYFRDDVFSNIRFADEASEKAKKSVDEFIVRSGYQMPENEDDPDDVRFEPDSYTGFSHLDLAANHISAIIWTCGFAGDFSYLKLPVTDSTGILKHNNGISDIKGLYYIGIPWLRKRKSGIVMGIKEDALFIAENLLNKRPVFA